MGIITIVHVIITHFLLLPFLRVKPAIFDLLLAVCIAAYLGTMYLAIQASQRIVDPATATHTSMIVRRVL